MVSSYTMWSSRSTSRRRRTVGKIEILLFTIFYTAFNSWAILMFFIIDTSSSSMRYWFYFLYKNSILRKITQRNFSIYYSVQEYITKNTKNTENINAEYINWRKLKIPNYKCPNLKIFKIQIYWILNFRILQLTDCKNNEILNCLQFLNSRNIYIYI